MTHFPSDPAQILDIQMPGYNLMMLTSLSTSVTMSATFKCPRCVRNAEEIICLQWKKTHGQVTETPHLEDGERRET